MNDMNLEKKFRDDICLRSSSEVMKLRRLGSFHQSRLSFMRQLLRKINKESWNFYSSEIRIGKEDTGYIIKKVYTQKRYYSLICFVHNISDKERSDRVIAEKWDLTFCLFDGIPSEKDIKRLSLNVPKQESSRMTIKELVLGRANKSLRAWKDIISSLSNGIQPSLKLIEEVGYIMRTTAVYGSGKFGLADREILENRSEFKAPFQVEMLSVYMLRSVIFDLIDFFSSKIGKKNSCKLDVKLKKKFGIGNSTGLGMAPFLINHPILLNNWIYSREKAIYKVRNIKKVNIKDKNLVIRLAKRMILHVSEWKTKDNFQIDNIYKLEKDLKLIISYLNDKDKVKKNFLWNELYYLTKKNFSFEGQEAFLSLMLEPYGSLIDKLGPKMSDYNKKYFKIDEKTKCQDLKDIIENNFSWSLKVDYNLSKNIEKFWYISDEKLEPRLGNRFKENGHEKEQPLSIGRDIKNLYEDLINFDLQEKATKFLFKKNQHRHTILRILETKDHRYSNIHENILSTEVRPIDLLRCKLSFFGANKFDPLSDRWLRICMFQGAPLTEEINKNYDDFWIY